MISKQTGLVTLIAIAVTSSLRCLTRSLASACRLAREARVAEPHRKRASESDARASRPFSARVPAPRWSRCGAEAGWRRCRAGEGLRPASMDCLPKAATKLFEKGRELVKQAASAVVCW